MLADTLGISDVLWQAIIAAAVTLYLARLNKQTKAAIVQTGTDAATKVAEVKMALAESQDATAKQVSKVETALKTETAKHDAKLDRIEATGIRTEATGKRTELYCNSALGRSLRLTATALRSKADGSHDPADIKAAELAEAELAKHMEAQAVIDAQNNGGQS